MVSRDLTTIQPLRDHMVRRLPSAKELAARTPLVLTARDDAILEAIATHGILTTEPIELAFFPTPPEVHAQRGAPCSRAYQRLRELWLWRFVERIELRVARALGGRRAFLYTLAERGQTYLAGQLASTATLPDPRRLDRLDDRFLEHDLRIGTLWAHMQALVRQEQFRACHWVPERDLHAQSIKVMDPLTNRPIAVLPDGYVELERLDGSVWSAMVEIDMATLTLGQFRRKLRAFETYVTGGLFQQDWQRDQCCFLILTTSWKRLKNLWKAGRQEVPPIEWRNYWFATYGALSPEHFDDSDFWLTLDGEYIGLC